MVSAAILLPNVNWLIKLSDILVDIVRLTGAYDKQLILFTYFRVFYHKYLI